MKAIDIIKPRHELFEAKLPGVLGVGQAAYDVAVAGLKAIYRFGTKGTKYSGEAKAFVDKYAKKYADEMSQRRMLGHQDDIPFAQWWQKELAAEPPTLPKLGRDGSPITGRDGSPIMEPNPRYADSVANQPFANNSDVVKSLGKEAEKQAKKVHNTNLTALSSARFEKWKSESLQAYNFWKGTAALGSLVNVAYNGEPVYTQWTDTLGGIETWKELGTTQPDFRAQMKAAGFDSQDQSDAAKDFIRTKLKPSSPEDMEKWISYETTVADRRFWTTINAAFTDGLAEAGAAAVILWGLKKFGLTKIAFTLSEIAQWGGIILYNRAIKEMSAISVDNVIGPDGKKTSASLNAAFANLMANDLLEVFKRTKYSDGSETVKLIGYDVGFLTIIKDSAELNKRGIIASLDKALSAVLESKAYVKRVGNALAGKDPAQPTTTAPAQPAAPTPAQPAPGAADDKKSTTPVDQPAPSDKPKVDANGVAQGEIGYTTASGWKIEHVLPDSIVWGNPKEGEKGKHVQLPKGQEP
jgi:hypothetical protein